MTAAMALHKREPVIDRIYAFEELRGTLDYLSAGRHFGNIWIQHYGKTPPCAHPSARWYDLVVGQLPELVSSGIGPGVVEY